MVSPSVVELSHYLPAVERLRHGQLPSRDFAFMFGPGLPDLLRGWLAIAGDSIGAAQDFFRFGWAVYVIVLGALIVRCGVPVLISTAMMVWFAIWSLPEPILLHSWGGPRYVPGLLTVLLWYWVAASVLTGASSVASKRVAVMGCLLPLLAVVALEQVIVALLAAGVVAVWDRDLRWVFAERRIRWSAVTGVLGGAGLLWLTGRGALLVSYAGQLGTFAIWRQPLYPQYLPTLTLYCALAALVFLTWWRHVRTVSSTSESAPDRVHRHGLLVLGLYALLQYGYALRAFANAQGVLATGVLMLWSMAALHGCWRMGRDHRRLLILAIAVLAVGPANNAWAGRQWVAQWRANLNGEPLGNPARLVPSRQPRLAGTYWDRWMRDDLDSLATLIAEEERVFGGEVTFLSHPETGLFEYMLARPASTRFPILALAETTPSWRASMLATLRRAPPRLIIRQRHIGALARSIGRQEELFPEIPAFLAQSYEQVAELKLYAVYRYRGP